MSSLPRVDHKKCDCNTFPSSQNGVKGLVFFLFLKHCFLSLVLSLGSLFPGGQTDITAATKALRQIALFIPSAY